MNAKTMFISLIPWLLFGVMIQRHGANFAGIAAACAAALAAALLVKNSRRSSVKLIDVTGIATFTLLGVACYVGGNSVTDWVADYGRGTSALVLAAVMLASCAVLPFSEQYARESVPSQYWSSTAFRSTNRRISAVWGLIVLVMACAHLCAGKLDPATAPVAGARSIDLVLNWALPIALITIGVNITKTLAAAATAPSRPPTTANPATGSHPARS